MKRIIFLLMSVLLITACSSNDETLETINFKDFKNLIEEKESFILEVKQDGCQYCTSFSPKLTSALIESDLKAKSLNISKLTQNEFEEFKELLSLSNFGTPSVFFIRDGIEVSSLKRISGDKEKEYIIAKFKSNGFIK